MKTTSRKTKLAKLAIGIDPKGRPVPAKVIQRHLADVRSEVQSDLAEQTGIQLDATKYSNKVSRPVKRSEAEKQDIARLAKKFRKQADAYVHRLPPFLPDITGFTAFSINFAPPYDFTDIDTDFTGPGNTASANSNTGQLALRFSNDINDGFLHFTSVRLGSIFFPPPGVASIRVSANPIASFSWWLNSPGPRAFTEGNLALHVVGFKGGQKHGESVATVQLWKENGDENNLGARFALGPANAVPLSTHFKMNSSDFYMISVRGFGVFGTSFRAPGEQSSFAAGTLAAAVPSITLDVEMEQVFQS